MIDPYKDRSEKISDDTVIAKQYIKEYIHIMKSDFKKQSFITNFFDYILYCLTTKCKLDYQRSIIIKHLIFRYRILPFYFNVFIISTPLIMLFSYLSYNHPHSLFGFFTFVLSVAVIFTSIISCLIYHEKREKV